jgi:3-dehydroquinate synthase
VITDENVAALFAEKVNRSLTGAGFRPTLIKVPPGERSKTIGEAEAICGGMIEAGLDRSSFVVALGGGMVGDLAGFVAAVFHRGIPCVQVPTTLLAQVDSSIGGKTAVNTTAGKNLIGAWHQPALVISDVETLTTLPAREWRQGLAEVVKHAVIRDAELFEMLQRFDRNELAPLVRRNVEIKAAIVSADERETSGERALLNIGISCMVKRSVSASWRRARSRCGRRACLNRSGRESSGRCNRSSCRHSCPQIFQKRKSLKRSGSTRSSKVARFVSSWCRQLAPPASLRM